MPAMTRGAKKAQNQKSNSVLHAPVTAVKKRRFVAKRAAPKRKAPSKPVVLEDQQMDESWFRRTTKGRENIKTQMKECYELACKAFESSRSFNPQGHCRMKFAGADDCLWKDVLEGAPAALERMQPVGSLVLFYVFMFYV